MLKTPDKDDGIGKNQVYKWFAQFKNGKMSFDDKTYSGYQQLESTTMLKKLESLCSQTVD